MPYNPEQKTTPETGEIISLRDFLTYENPNLPRYQELIRRENKDKRYLPQSFAVNLGDILYDPHKEGEEAFDPPRFDKLREYLKIKLDGGLLIDVGGGDEYKVRFMREFARKFNVKEYINVDSILFGDSVPLDAYTAYPAGKMDFYKSSIRKSEQERPIIEMHVKSDLLDFVARLPSNSANFVVNGIDEFVLKTPEYREALNLELIRATRVGGIMFGSGSDVLNNRGGRLLSKTEELDVKGIPYMQIEEKIKE